MSLFFPPLGVGKHHSPISPQCILFKLCVLPGVSSCLLIMSLLMDGCPARMVVKSPSGGTVLSAHFVNNNFPGRTSGSFVVTIHVPPYGNFSCQLECHVSPFVPNDVALGTQWEAFVRDWLLEQGKSLTSTFDACAFCLNPVIRWVSFLFVLSLSLIFSQSLRDRTLSVTALFDPYLPPVRSLVLCMLYHGVQQLYIASGIAGPHISAGSFSAGSRHGVLFNSIPVSLNVLLMCLTPS